MPKFAASLAVLCLLAAGGAQAQMANNTNPDLQFAHKAASSGAAEVALGKMALDKSSRQDVRDFAQRMVDDHTKLNGQMAQLAQHQHLRLPKQAVGEDAEAVKRLSSLSGPEFDRAYMTLMTQDHRRDVAAFEKEASEGSVPPIKTLASKAVPTLRQHLAMAEQLQQAVGEERAQAGSSRSSTSRPQ